MPSTVYGSQWVSSPQSQLVLDIIWEAPQRSMNPSSLSCPWSKVNSSSLRWDPVMHDTKMYIAVIITILPKPTTLLGLFVFHNEYCGTWGITRFCCHCLDKVSSLVSLFNCYTYCLPLCNLICLLFYLPSLRPRLWLINLLCVTVLEAGLLSITVTLEVALDGKCTDVTSTEWLWPV